MHNEEKYMTQQQIMVFLGFDYEFENSKDYPFKWGTDKVKFQWATIIIPRGDIEKIILDKLSSDPKGKLQTEINMIVQIPFMVERKDESMSMGIVNQNISLSFRYDKTWKYGEISKNIGETCFYIHDNAQKTNDFYILSDESGKEFLNYFVINNQWGLGARITTSGLMESFEVAKTPVDTCDTADKGEVNGL